MTAAAGAAGAWVLCKCAGGSGNGGAGAGGGGAAGDDGGAGRLAAAAAPDLPVPVPRMAVPAFMTAAPGGAGAETAGAGPNDSDAGAGERGAGGSGLDCVNLTCTIRICANTTPASRQSNEIARSADNRGFFSHVLREICMSVMRAFCANTAPETLSPTHRKRGSPDRLTAIDSSATLSDKFVPFLCARFAQMPRRKLCHPHIESGGPQIG